MSGISFACRVNVSGGASVQGDVFDDRGVQVPLGRWVGNCSAPMRLHWLLPGNWSLEVNATDDAGNSNPVPTTTRWSVAFQPNTPYVRFTAGALGLTNRNTTRFQLTTLVVRGQQPFY